MEKIGWLNERNRYDVYNNINLYNIRTIIINIIIYQLSYTYYILLITLLSIPAQPPLLYTKIIGLSSSFGKVFCKHTVKSNNKITI